MSDFEISVVSVKRGEQKGDSLAGGGGVLEMLRSQFSELNQRGRVALEFVTTERSYIQILRQTVESFLKPLRNGACPTMKPRLVPVIFLNLEKILEANTAFLRDLEYHVYSPTFLKSGVLGTAFDSLIPALELYPEYVKNHWRAILEVNKNESTNREFAVFLQHSKETSEAKLDLLSCLIAPVQRIPRYLSKNTEDGHSDKPLIDRVLKYVSELADRVNGDMRKQENFQKQLKLQRAFVGNIANIASYDRTLIRDGPLSKRVRYGSVKPRWFFLFNDCLIYAKTVQVPSVGIDTYAGHLFSLCRFLSHISARNTTQHEGNGNAFEIVSLQKSFTVFAETPEDKKAWMADIRAVGGGAEGTHAPVWMPDTETTRCLLCDQKFTLTVRRHHCRQCGKVVCGQCSTQRARLAHLDISTDPVRVCDVCAQGLGLQKTGPKVPRSPQSFMKLITKIIPGSAAPAPAPAPAAGQRTSPQEPEITITRTGGGHPGQPATKAATTAVPLPVRPSLPAPRPPQADSTGDSSSGLSSPADTPLSQRLNPPLATSPTQGLLAAFPLGRRLSSSAPQQQGTPQRHRSTSGPPALASVDPAPPVAPAPVVPVRDLIDLEPAPAPATAPATAPAAAKVPDPLVDLGITKPQTPRRDLIELDGLAGTDLIKFDEVTAPVAPDAAATRPPAVLKTPEQPSRTENPPLTKRDRLVDLEAAHRKTPPVSPNPNPRIPTSAVPAAPRTGMGLLMFSPFADPATSPRSQISAFEAEVPVAATTAAAVSARAESDTTEGRGGGSSNLLKLSYTEASPITIRHASEWANPFASPTATSTQLRGDSRQQASETLPEEEGDDATDEDAEPATDEENPFAVPENPQPGTSPADDNPFATFSRPR